MKRNLSYILLMTGLLLIGFAIGFLVSGRMIKSKVEDMRSYYTPNGFNRHVIRVLDPTDEQLQNINPILIKYAQLNEEMMSDCKNSQRELFLELNEELKPWLSEKQMERLSLMPQERFLKNQSNVPSDNRKHRNGIRRQGKHRRVAD